MADLTIRLAEPADAEAIRTIYNVEVLDETSTFDLVPRSLAEQEAWLADRSGAFSAIVAVDDEAAVVGFAALSPYKPRAAYSTTVEDSVYVDRPAAARGSASSLLTSLLDVATASGFHAVMARIEASGTASWALHAPLRVRAGRRSSGRSAASSTAGSTSP